MTDTDYIVIGLLGTIAGGAFCLWCRRNELPDPFLLLGLAVMCFLQFLVLIIVSVWRTYL